MKTNFYSRLLRSLPTASVLLFSIGNMTAHAATVALYDAGLAGNPAPDPTSAAGGGWTRIAQNTDGQTVGVQDGVYSAWQIQDPIFSTAHLGPGYLQFVSDSDIAMGQNSGWRLEARIRMVDDYDGLLTHFVGYDDGVRRYGLWLDLDENEDLIVFLQTTEQVVPDSPQFPVTSDGSGTAAYHDYLLVFDPDAGAASFLLDGTLLLSGFEGIPTNLPTDPFDNEIYFGAGSSRGQGVANYNLVEFSVVPIPAALWLFASCIAGLGILSRRKRQRS